MNYELHPDCWHDWRTVAPPQTDAMVARVRGQLPVVDGEWTTGLFDCFSNQDVQQAVHLPCWPTFVSAAPCFCTTGLCFGRSCKECLSTGLTAGRMARVRVALASTAPGGTRDAYELDSDRTVCQACLCLAHVVGSGWCPNIQGGLSALCTHSNRVELRRRYNLPPCLGLPAPVDDCIVHCCCAYCAGHQELREMALRGADGYGVHILDVMPSSFDHAQGGMAAANTRNRILEQKWGIVGLPPPMAAPTAAGAAPGAMQMTRK